MNPKNFPLSQEEVKRRRSAQINSFPPINLLLNNLGSSYKSTTNLASAEPIFKSNSLFAYQELDKFSSFCDDGSIQSELLSDTKKNSQNNNMNNNNSTKLEEFEESESCEESFDNNNDMSEDEIFLKKYNKRMDKRKSALHVVPPYFQNLSSFNKPNEPIPNNNFSNSDKKMNRNDNNNNFVNNKNLLVNNNYPYNMRRGSYSMNQFRNDLFFNNILYQNQNKFIFPPNKIENNNQNNINEKNNYLNNNIINNNQNMNYMQNIQNPNTSFNFIPNFPYNNYFNPNNNNIINPNKNTKKRNSLILKKQIQPSQITEHRRSSVPLSSNFQMLLNEKLNEKSKLKEENPSFFLKDQNYCRQIQTKLEKNINNVKYSEEFYENIKPRLIEIIEHQFGNYVIQKFLCLLLSQGNKIIFEDIFLEIKDQLYSICVHNYGTRVIQKTLEKLENGNYSKMETEKLNSVFQNLIEKHLYDLCCDKNGNHVYQKLLRIFPKENNKNNFLFDELIKISYEVSIIQQGATLLGVAFDQGNEEQKQKLCEAIVERIGDLIIDKYGNYTIQTVFKLYNEKINEKIFKYIDDNLLRLSKEKFSSNVIDKCIVKDYDKSYKFIQSIIQKNVIKDIIIDQYGNYIVQKALSVSDDDTVEKIMEQVKPMVGELQKTNIGKKIYEKLWKNYKDYLE